MNDNEQPDSTLLLFSALQPCSIKCNQWEIWELGSRDGINRFSLVAYTTLNKEANLLGASTVQGVGDELNFKVLNNGRSRFSLE